jgi:hypothetical protein
MSRVLCAFLCLGLAGQLEAADAGSIEVRVGGLNGILDLAVSYCGGHGESVALQRVLESAGYRSGEPPAVMVRFCSVDLGQGGHGQPDRPLAYDTDWSSPWQRFRNAAVSSPDMAALIAATSGSLPFDEAIVIDAMEYMAPIYERLVTQPLGQEANAMGSAMTDYVARNQVTALLHSVSNLYATTWPRDSRLWLGLSPTPPNSGGFSATAHGDVIRSFMPVDFDDPATYTGVVAHEFAHLLFARMPSDQVRLISGAFANSGSPSKRFAEAWMNEALATAVGNGWVYSKLSGGDEDDEWYADPVVDSYARAIAPSVYDALESGRPLDDRMVAGFIEAFDRLHPDAMCNADVLFAHAAIVSDVDPDAMSLMRSLYGQRIQIRRLDGLTPAAAEVTELPATVLSVEIDGARREAVHWQRKLHSDGSIRFSTRIQDPADFGRALDALLLSVNSNEWSCPPAEMQSAAR